MSSPFGRTKFSKPPSSSQSIRTPLKSSSVSNFPASVGNTHNRKRVRTNDVSDSAQEVSDVDRATRPVTGKGKAREDAIDLDVDEPEGSQTYNTKAGVATTRVNGRERHKDRTVEREIEELRRRLEQAQSARDSYSSQLKALHALRITEPEQLAEEKTKWLEERYKADQEVIAQLRIHAGLTPDEQSNGSPRKTAAAIRELKQEVDGLTQRIKLHEADLERKDRLVRQLRTALQDARSQPQQNPLTQSTSKKNTESIPPYVSQVIQLYEDLTQLSILDVKVTPSTTSSGEETIFWCVVTSLEKTRSLAFKLTFFNKPSTDETGTLGEAEQVIAYQPTSTEMETDTDLLESLDLYVDSFQFIPEQLHVFLKNIVERVTGDPRQDED